MTEKGYQSRCEAISRKNFMKFSLFEAQESLLLLEELDHRSFQATTITYNVSCLDREG